MTTAILDTNVLISAAMGSPQAAASWCLDAYYEGKYRLIFSPATTGEVLDVLTRPHIRARHDWTDDEILRFLTTLLALAEEAGARYLVTKDRRHLLQLGHYHQTRIVTPAEFLRKIL